MARRKAVTEDYRFKFIVNVLLPIGEMKNINASLEILEKDVITLTWVLLRILRPPSQRSASNIWGHGCARNS